uniref:Uncharacterized protein n=1 Tax=Eutreptiella gymnastica TaxID=73025 RepID=A0A7S4GJC0_9EUGL|mmetsp:Transcript_38510/g.62702  ORF Transcript_38510/g.62702 Transcript_38510/m.62702 type:complete len:145 (+) Transcript_38510:158-592(+)
MSQCRCPCKTMSGLPHAQEHTSPKLFTGSSRDAASRQAKWGERQQPGHSYSITAAVARTPLARLVRSIAYLAYLRVLRAWLSHQAHAVGVYLLHLGCFVHVTALSKMEQSVTLCAEPARMPLDVGTSGATNVPPKMGHDGERTT